MSTVMRSVEADDDDFVVGTPTTPEMLRAKISARRASSGESTEVNRRPRTSPTIPRPLIHLTDDAVPIDDVRGHANLPTRR
jgi:hypothetical protein